MLILDLGIKFQYYIQSSAELNIILSSSSYMQCVFWCPFTVSYTSAAWEKLFWWRQPLHVIVLHFSVNVMWLKSLLRVQICRTLFEVWHHGLFWRSIIISHVSVCFMFLSRLLILVARGQAASWGFDASHHSSNPRQMTINLHTPYCASDVLVSTCLPVSVFPPLTWIRSVCVYCLFHNGLQCCSSNQNLEFYNWVISHLQ